MKPVKAAFKNTEGKVATTGSFHNIEELPEDFGDISSEGFVDTDGKYWTREETTKELHLENSVRSEDLDLQKRESEYKIEPPVQDGNELVFKMKHIPSGKHVGWLTLSKPISEGKYSGFRGVKEGNVALQHQRQGIYSQLLSAAHNHLSKDPNHKGIVSLGHWREPSATGAWKKFSRKNKNVQTVRGKEVDSPDFLLAKEENLLKFQTPPKFPGLGIKDDRKETPIIDNKLSLDVKNRALANAQSSNTKSRLKLLDSYSNAKPLGIASSVPNRSISYALANKMRRNTPRGQDNNAPLATQHHENFHMIMNRVSDLHGHKARQNLAHNLYHSMPKKSQEALNQFISHRYGKGKIDPRLYHEEHLTGLLNYLNTPAERSEFHSKMGHDDNKIKEFDAHLKHGFRAIQRAALNANKKWVSRPKFGKSENWEPSFKDLRTASEWMFTLDIELPEFKAAKFMANDYEPSDEDVQNAMQEYEGDIISACLAAHRLPVTVANKELLLEIMNLGDLNKSEFKITDIPRIIKPFNNHAIPFSELANEAQVLKLIHPFKTQSKHASGAALLKSPKDDSIWFLKPNSGSSRALGMSDEKISFARREVAFNEIAKLVGLSAYVPESALLIVDSQEVAMMQFFSDGFESCNKLKDDPNVDLFGIFSLYVPNGLIYKWAALDYICANVDRHAGNILMSEGFEIKLIDAGSSFAGHSFDPAKDPKSFIPFYLRVLVGRDFRTLSSEERFKKMPKIPLDSDMALKFWLDGLNVGEIVRILNEYQINPQPVLNRLNNIRNYPGLKSEFLAKFWSGCF